MSDNKITDYTSVSKSNHKILKFITIILSILIVICLFFLIIGFINKFGELEKKEKPLVKILKVNIPYIIQKTAKLSQLTIQVIINYY